MKKYRLKTDFPPHRKGDIFFNDDLRAKQNTDNIIIVKPSGFSYSVFLHKVWLEEIIELNPQSNMCDRLQHILSSCDAIFELAPAGGTIDIQTMSIRDNVLELLKLCAS